MTKLVVIINQDQLKALLSDPDILISDNVWVGRNKTNKALNDSGNTSEGDVILHLSIDSMYRAEGALKFQKIEHE